jgi:hypothetical protein
MQGVFIKRPRRDPFHDAAQVHDRDCVGHMLDDGQVMGNEQVTQSQLFLKRQQQVEDLGLDGDIQR